MLTLPSLWVLLELCVGLGLLICGAEVLYRAVVRGTHRLRMPRSVIVLAALLFGSCVPSASYSLQAAWQDSNDLALGTILGFTLTLLWLGLGTSALLRPFNLDPRIARRDTLWLLAAGILFYVLLQDGQLSRTDGVILVLAGVIYALRRGQIPVRLVPEAPSYLRARYALIQGLIACIFIFFGSQWMAESSVALAQSLGLSEWALALTIIALGLSTPEILTLLTTSARQRAWAQESLLGNCIFNLLWTTGLICWIAPDPIDISPNTLKIDAPVLLAVLLLTAAVGLTQRRLGRVAGLLLISHYAAYGLYWVLWSSGHSLLARYQTLLQPYLAVCLVLWLWVLWHDRRYGRALQPA